MLTQNSYSATEGDQLDVCVSLDGALEVSISVELSLEPDEQLPPEMMAISE